MFLGNFVIYTVFVNIILLMFKKSQSVKLPKKIQLLVSLIMIILICNDIKTTFDSENIYKFFNIKRNFTKKDLEKGKRDLMKKCHPDNIDDDSNNTCFYKAQEIHEIFTSKTASGLIKAYNSFQIDIQKIYFSKYETKDYKVYHKQYFENLNIEYYIIIFIQLFILKEIKNSNFSLKIISAVFIGLSYLLEIVFYGFYDIGIKSEVLIAFLDKVSLFDYMTYYQIIFLIKRILFSLLFIYLMTYLLLKKKKISFLSILENLQEKLSSGDLKSVDFAIERNLLQTKLKKEIALNNSRNKVYVIFGVCSLAYVAGLYYGTY